MATNVVQKQNKEEKKPVPVVISEYIMKHRKVIMAFLAGTSAIVLAIVVYSVVVEKKNTAAIARIESLLEQWETAKTENEGQALTKAEDTILAELDTITAKNKNLSSGARANLVAAELYFNRKDWNNARERYLAAAQAKESIYTAPIAYYNAAVCSEELADMEQAIALYNKAMDHESFTMKPRALFNIGRIEEQRGNRDLAIASYEKMAESYPDDSWTLLAKSRIIALQIQ